MSVSRCQCLGLTVASDKEDEGGSPSCGGWAGGHHQGQAQHGVEETGKEKSVSAN